jgi:hypothetical protein
VAQLTMHVMELVLLATLATLVPTRPPALVCVLLGDSVLETVFRRALYALVSVYQEHTVKQVRVRAASVPRAATKACTANRIAVACVLLAVTALEAPRIRSAWQRALLGDSVKLVPIHPIAPDLASLDTMVVKVRRAATATVIATQGHLARRALLHVQIAAKGTTSPERGQLPA